MTGIAISELSSWLAAAGMLEFEPLALGTPISDTFASACVDSRLARPGCLFVALEGERVDGHDFVDDAITRGAVGALISAEKLQRVRMRVFGSATLFSVASPLAAVQEVARRWRAQYPDLVRVAVTGSNGKTTTKELIAAILSRTGSTIFSRGNYNSDIGLPLELLRIRPEHRYGVFELGMNRPGEIAELAAIVEPDVAVITNVGSAHVGMVGSRKRIAEEKKSIFGRFTGTQTAVVPPSGEFSRFLVADVDGSVVRYGRSSAKVLRVESAGLDGALLRMREGEVQLRLPGEHMISNALAAISVARVLDVPFEAIKAGIESVRPMFGRSEVIRGRVTVVQDCYNANPESVTTALATLTAVSSTGRRIAILGSMKELGDQAAALHRDVIAVARAAELDEVWLVGDEFERVAEQAPGVRVYGADDWDALERDAAAIADGTVVLVKGSRLLELERLTPVIQQGQRTPVKGAAGG